MPAPEQPTKPEPDATATPEENVLQAWQQLPVAQQVVVGMEILATLMGSEQRQDLRAKIASRWPISTAQLAEAMSRVEITHADLKTAGFNQDEISRLEEDDLLTLSRHLRDQYAQAFFWPALEHATEALLAEKRELGFAQIVAASTKADRPFYTWLAAVDRRAWAITERSIYDYPDADFRSMFADGLTPFVALTRVLKAAQIDNEEE